MISNSILVDLFGADLAWLAKRIAIASDVVAVRHKDLADEESQKFGTFVTEVDCFVQDYITTRLRVNGKAWDVICEERTWLNPESTRIGQLGEALLIDPVDGTKWLADGSGDYSVMLTYVQDGLAKETIVIWPAQQSRTWVVVNNQLHELVAGKEARRIRMAKNINTESADRVLAHYRGMGPGSRVRNQLLGNGCRICVNGEGFGTNGSAARQVVEGLAVAFVANCMGVIDGFPAASLIEAAGGVIQFFDVTCDELPWVPVSSWRCSNLGDQLGVRCRFVAARDSDTLDRIADMLIS